MNNPKKMHKGSVSINGNRFSVSYAIEEKEQIDGLMHVSPPLTSMAFLYTLPQINKFWMKDVQADLDIVFCYKGKITNIIRGEAYSHDLLGENNYSDLVLEFPTRILEEYPVKIGDDVKMSLSKEAVNLLLAS